MLFRRPRDFKTELAGFFGEGRDQAAHVNDFCAFVTEDSIQIKVFDVQPASDFSGSVILHARATRSPTAVGHINLVAITPRIVLFKFRAFEIHVTTCQVIFDEPRDGA